MRIAGVVCFTILSAGAFMMLHAELPPKVYSDLRDASPEHIEITVRKVSRGFCIACTRQKILVRAEVVKVLRTSTGLKPGDIICIGYEHHRPRRGWVGPRPVPILEEGGTCYAYLRKGKNTDCFEPAAAGASFEKPSQRH